MNEGDWIRIGCPIDDGALDGVIDDDQRHAEATCRVCGRRYKLVTRAEAKPGEGAAWILTEVKT